MYSFCYYGVLLEFCFLGAALEDAVEGIGEGEKGDVMEIAMWRQAANGH